MPEAHPPPAAVQAAISAAVAWLARARSNGQWWVDYQLGQHRSDEYVTAFVGAAMVDVPGARELVHHAWLQLMSRVPFRSALFGQDGWGWNLWMPSDADTTAFALRIARAVGQADAPGAMAAAEFVRTHLQAEGARTFRGPGDVPELARSHPGAWLEPTPCVTASVALAMPSAERRRLADSLARGQDPSGCWHGYWWVTPDYPTGLAATALDPREHRRALLAVGAWLRSSPPPRGAFDTAWRLRAAQAAGRVTDAHLAVAESLVGDLIASQRQDGSWPASALLRMPHPEDSRPDFGPGSPVDEQGLGAVTIDQNAVVSTASAVAALNDHVRGWALNPSDPSR